MTAPRPPAWPAICASAISGASSLPGWHTIIAWAIPRSTRAALAWLRSCSGRVPRHRPGRFGGRDRSRVCRGRCRHYRHGAAFRLRLSTPRIATGPSDNAASAYVPQLLHSGCHAGALRAHLGGHVAGAVELSARPAGQWHRCGARWRCFCCFGRPRAALIGVMSHLFEQVDRRSEEARRARGANDAATGNRRAAISAESDPIRMGSAADLPAQDRADADV